MLFILVGAHGAGKTTLLERLQSRFKVLRPSTTRQPRYTGESEYEFVRKWDPDLYSWSIKVGIETYGMRKAELARAEYAVCATVFDPLSIAALENFRQQTDIEIVTVGLDTISSLAEQAVRVADDPKRVMTAAEFTQAQAAVQSCDLVLSGTSDLLEQAVITFSRILGSRGGNLVAADISALTSAGCLLTGIDPAHVQSASYDLALGDQAWCHGKLIELSDANPTVKIPPYSYAIVVAKELAAFPKFITGRFDLTVSMFLRGVILSNGPQVDPGYRGPFFCMLFNSSSMPRHLVRGRHFATVEFTTTTRRALGYHQQYQLQKRLEQIMDEAAFSSPGGTIVETLESKVSTLDREIRSIREPVRNTMWAFLAVMSAIILVVLGLVLNKLGDAQALLAEAKFVNETAKERIAQIERQGHDSVRSIEAAKRSALRELSQKKNSGPSPRAPR